MILETLKVTNFRVFKGEHEFDLAPKQRAGIKPPIILFGGLNGAGKTTTLTAIRLVLYGRQSLGTGTNQKEYNQYLCDCVHKSKTTNVQANFAAIDLKFTYANLGVLSHYHVKRSWTITGNKVTESLKIAQNDTIIRNLSYEQAQGFLNELIPIGVSDLFFFDGEKIAQLAEDSDGNILGDSVKKLIGLDLIEKLIADITVFIRQQNKQQVSDDIRKKIEALESVLNEKEELIEQEQKAYESAKILLTESSKKIDQLTNRLNSQGGAWAASREKEIQNLSGLTKEKEIIQNQIREGLSGSFPFSIAPDFVQSCLNQLNIENEFKRKKTTAEFLSQHLAALESRLINSMDQDVFHHVKQEIHKEFSDLLKFQKDTILIHDVSDSLHKKVEATALNAINVQGKQLAELAKKLTAINHKIDSSGVNIARAPEEGLLSQRLEELNIEQDKKTQSSLKVSQHKENIKSHLRGAMDTVRLLDKLHGSYIQSDENNRALDLAHKAKNSLAEFAQRVSIMKIKDVENEFINSFKKLARKGDISIRAKIEPETFAVKIFDNFDNEIPKDNLSAGEKQIYAIAILEALAKTSGRKLPIIIDTPLGRLDSKHRRKLVENYFPTASHQVIILSTDTEIDESFHKSLSEHISHTIKLDYKESIASTIAGDGYFWPTAQAV